MSDIHEGFRLRLSQAFERVASKIEETLEQAKREGTLRTGTDVARLAQFIVAAFEGAFMMGKLHRNADLVSSVVEELKAHVMHYHVA
jgi:hypothetical protein